MASKSLDYCYPTNNTALILLCEVALGNVNELLATDYNAVFLPKGKHSTKGCGLIKPGESIIENGIEIPLGKPVKSNQKVNFFLILDFFEI